jgi:membrane-associated PAP2 superfamily phosphatase
MTYGRFYTRSLAASLAAFLCVLTIVAATDLDVTLARWLFFNESLAQWRGADSWIANELLHTGGRWLTRALVAASILAWLSTFTEIAPRWRRSAAFLTLSIVVTVAITAWLKTVTNVDCPWDLTIFGGQYPYVPLFADRPDDLRYGRCFPAAHASSGYALMALYFVFLERGRMLARAGLVVGIGLGLAFGFAQQSRGAHFLSHDLWSAMIAWIVPLTLYSWVFRARLWVPRWQSADRQRQNSHFATDLDPEPSECSAVHGRNLDAPSPVARTLGRPSSQGRGLPYAS